MITARIAALTAACIIIAGCGSSGSSSTDTSSSSTTNAAPTAAASSMTSSDESMRAAAPIPPDLKCSDAIVWVNLSSKAYHLSGDKYYGRSKHGEYMCEAMAESKGYHLAGSAHGHGSMKAGATEEPSPSAT